jgi:cytochrome d ubiquinol oxidase subunit I
MIMRRKRGVERSAKPMLYALVGMSFGGWLATLAGWYTLVDVSHGLSDCYDHKELSLTCLPRWLSTLIAYLVVYAALLGAYIFFL